MSGSFFQPQLSGRWKKIASLFQPASARPVVVPVQPRLSVSQITTYRAALPDELAALAATGSQSIGLWRTKLSKYDDETVAALLHEFGVKPASLSWAGGFTGSLGFTFEEALQDARDAVRQAAWFDAETLVMLTGSRNGHTVNHCKRTVKDALLLLGDEAGDRGVRLAVLPIQPKFHADWSYLHGLDDTLQLLDEIRHPQVGLAFDTLQLWQTPNLLERIPEIVPRTHLVQVCDCALDAEYPHNRRLPGDGELPLPEIMRQFLTHGYQGYFDIQVGSEDVWRRALPDVLHACRHFASTVSGVVTRFE